MDKIEPYDRPATNYVHKQIIHSANISKEKKYETKNQKLEYTFSPYTCKYNLIFHIK